MASNQRSLNATFGISAGQTGDIGRKINESSVPSRSTTRIKNSDEASAALSVPVIIAMGVILWLALHNYD